MTKNEHEFVIHLDQHQFKVLGPTITGAGLRALTEPPIGPERDLYEVIPGPEGDRLVANESVVTLRDGQHFFTAPGTISAG